MNDVQIYKNVDNHIEISVQFQGETVWLSQKLIAELYEKDTDTIGLHLKNIYVEGELSEYVTAELFSVVQKEGKRQVTRKIKYYNLDAIISVGYRVNSPRGTQFRQWATQRLKDYLALGYAINQKRLEDLGLMVRLIDQTSKTDPIQLSEAKGLLTLLTNYAKSFLLLSQYDRQAILTGNLSSEISYIIEYDEAKSAIKDLKKHLIYQKEATDLFGYEKDESFKSSLQTIAQTFDQKYLYPSIEEQAANLLYFVIKNHSFIDGNKRIGAFLFVWFLEKNKHHFKSTGEIKINDNTLVAVALLVAQSKPGEKDLMIQLVVNMITNQ